MMYSVSYALRVVRVGVICSVVPERERTNVLAKHALMTPLGAVFGPLVWIAAEMYRGSVWIDVFGARKRGTGGGKGEMDVMMMMKSMMMTGSNMTERLPPSTSSLNSVTLSSLSHYWRLQPQQQPESPIITTPSHHQERNSIRNPSLFLPHFHQHQHHSYGDVENDNYYSPSAAPAAAPPGVVVFDRFFLAYAAAAAVFFLISVVALRYLSRVGELAIDNGNGNGERTEEDRGHGGGMTARGKKQSWAMLTFDDGRSEWVDLTTYRRRTVVFFAGKSLRFFLNFVWCRSKEAKMQGDG